MGLDSVVAPARLTGGSCIDLWYADDGVLMGEGQAVLKTFRIIDKCLKSCGLEINTRKCRAWMETEVPPPPEVPEAGRDAAPIVLGYPVTTGCSSVAESCGNAAKEHQESFAPSRL